MEDKKQTAVEWLVERWEKLQSRKEKGSWSQIIRITEQAKEIEKKQMKEIYLKGIKNYDPTFKKPMSNKKQTAVEWLIEEIKLKAKAIEQEQIQEAFKQGYECNDVDEIFEIGETMFTAKGHYNKKYGGDTIQNKQERMYSAEEVIKIVEISRTTGLTAEYLIEQFKHKHIK
jgi:hypothetical protein